MLFLQQNNKAQKESPTDKMWDFFIKGEAYEEEKEQS